MKGFIQPENAHQQAVLLSNEVLLTTASGDEYRLTRRIAQKRNASASTSEAILFFSNQSIEQEPLLHQLQQEVEAILAKNKVLLYALFREVTPSDVSYYILLKDNWWNSSYQG